MKRWAILIVFLYGLLLVLLTMPLGLLYSFKWSWTGKNGVHLETPLDQWLEIYQEWGYWLFIGVLLLCQAALLLIPLKVSQKKLVPRRHVLVPIITAGFLLGCLCLAAIVSILCALYGDEGFAPFMWLYQAIESGPVWRYFATTLSLGRDPLGWLTAAFAMGLFWMLWGYLFYRFSHLDTPDSLLTRTLHWLLRGSILELLIAVPSHIVIRGRNDCCAPYASFCGIVTGISVMLLSFGPGIFFLFAQRARRLRVQPKVEAQTSS